MKRLEFAGVKLLQETLTILSVFPAGMSVADCMAEIRKQAGITLSLPSAGKAGALCPSCGAGQLLGPYKIDGLRLQRCSLKCGYSEVVF